MVGTGGAGPLEQVLGGAVTRELVLLFTPHLRPQGVEVEDIVLWGRGGGSVQTIDVLTLKINI